MQQCNRVVEVALNLWLAGDGEGDRAEPRVRWHRIRVLMRVARRNSEETSDDRGQWNRDQSRD
jgi:hypothetical protein